MIGIVIITHGNLAREFRAVLEHVVGPQDQIAAIAITPDDDMEERREAILRAMKSVDTGDGAVLLTDMFGGTPSNLAISAMNGANVEVIAGVNLPMLIKLARVREENRLREAADEAREAGQKYIRVVSDMLAGS
jgi:PTS system mannose-specific IIA component